MAFKLTPNPTFKAKVKIHVPGQDKPGEIEFVFKHKTKAEFERLFGEAGKDMSDEDLVMEIASNWDVEDTPFSREAIEQLFQDHLAAPNAVVQAYVEELKGARRGN